MLAKLNHVTEGALELQAALREGEFEFCIIGGLAVQRWGEPRLTRDADATVLTRFTEDERTVDFLLAKFPGRSSDAREFALRFRVVLLRAANGIDLDVALGALDFEERCIARATEWAYRPGVHLQTCSAEDLIVHKAFASRDRDWLDVDGICARQGESLDIRQVFEELTPLAEYKEDSEILPRLRQIMASHHLGE